MNTYQKGIIVGFALLVAAIGPVSVGAATIGELQAQVQGLLAQIASYGGTTSSGSGVGVAMPAAKYRACSLVGRNLGWGSRGDDVRSLQEFLQGQGYLSAAATGYYGAMTAQAVAKWQTSQGVSAIGAFGPLSRDRFKTWCGNWGSNPSVPFNASPTQGIAPLSVTFSTWLSGFRMATTYYTIDFGDGTSERAADCYAPADACMSAGQNAHTYAQNGTYTATLNKITDICANSPLTCKAPIQTEVIAKTSIVVTSGTATCRPINYMPIACSDGTAAQPQHNESGCIIGYECPVANYTPPTSCKSWNDGCNSCSRQSPDAPAACTMRACFAAGKGYCSVYFDAPTSSNRPPVVSGLSGPTTLAINQTGTWTVQASDPENGTLSYQITWGDENIYTPMMGVTASMQAFTQTSTFTHAYASAGTYTVTVTVRDASGQQAAASATVQVGAGNVACTMQYDPVCGQPPEPACRHAYPACMIATPGPQTYGNTCVMNAAGATFLYSGTCANGY